jgi:hypothetical protein
MNFMASLESVHAKVVRAKQHYEALTTELNRYLQGKRSELLMEANLQTNTVRVVGIEGPTVPDVIPVIIGDCLQNLRSALDYLVWELVLAANSQPSEKNAFPICGTAKGFKESLRRGSLNGVPEEATTLIQDLQPYNGGDRWKETVLWILNELCNINKHRRILLTQLTASFMLGERMLPQNYARITTASGGQMEVDAEVVAFVAFNEGVVKGTEVCAVIDQIAREVWEKIAPLFVKFFY